MAMIGNRYAQYDNTTFLGKSPRTGKLFFAHEILLAKSFMMDLTEQLDYYDYEMERPHRAGG